MRTDNQTITRLSDYRPADHLIDRIELTIRLHPTATRVSALLSTRPNPAGIAGAPLRLDGDELVLLGAFRDGEPLAEGAFTASPDAFVLHAPPAGPFTLALETELNPTANTKLMGLYRSGGVYCTQCEAEGFRRITYAIDRPDVLSVYRTRIEADPEEAPVLLGNGNPVEAGELGDGRHYAIWDDPHPKPGYLFALVGGQLGHVAKPYFTAGGRPVTLAVHVEPGKEDRAAYALDALERSMRWDERVFGRDYDLDVFNVVAVPDFNMGAMENKGLNIFNDKYVLASPDTATDADYAGIETVVAHEYFHNWTGNRITCRDWFQLCLKEGLTVFRDQEFSSDERSRAVQRIAQVRMLRARQFPEDAGPLAHPVRPSEYREINNFYTATVYEKGAEIVRMLRLVLGEADFARGMTRFFDTCDGTAATVEEFLAAFAAVSGRDLAPFARWYDQAGTPTLVAETRWDAARGSLRLAFTQTTAPTPGQPDKAPLVIPIAYGLVSDRDLGAKAGGGLFVLAEASGAIEIDELPVRPVPSLLRGFSAPVRLMLDLDDAALLTLLRHDMDAFNRWQSAQTVAQRILCGEALDRARVEAFGDALSAFLDREAAQDPAFGALVLGLPGETEIAQEIPREVDPDAIHAMREEMRRLLGDRLAPTLGRLVADFAPEPAYSPDAASAGRRALRNAALDLLAAGRPAEGEALAARQFDGATNMTDRLAALGTLARIPGEARSRALAAFEARYANEPLALDKWFSLQASIAEDGTLDRVRRLMVHPAFSMANPNRVRALIGAFTSANPTQFHRPDGAGYGLLAETVLALDGANPQLAARLLTAFGTWRRLEPGRRARAEAALRRFAEAPSLSADVTDIVKRSLQPA